MTEKELKEVSWTGESSQSIGRETVGTLMPEYHPQFRRPYENLYLSNAVVITMTMEDIYVKLGL